VTSRTVGEGRHRE